MLPKECPVDRLTNGVTKGDSGHWVKTVENYPESHSAWHGATHVLRSARRCKDEIDPMMFRQIISEIRASEEDKLSSADWTFEDKSSNFHTFLFNKIDANLAGRAGTKGQTGFELWRELCN